MIKQTETLYLMMFIIQVGTINYMESRLNKMNEERRGKLRERRRQENKDTHWLLDTGCLKKNSTLLVLNISKMVRPNYLSF